MGMHGPVVNVVEKIYTSFARKTCCLKPSCVRYDMETLLSLWYREAHNTVTSLLNSHRIRTNKPVRWSYIVNSSVESSCTYTTSLSFFVSNNSVPQPWVFNNNPRFVMFFCYWKLNMSWCKEQVLKKENGAPPPPTLPTTTTVMINFDNAGALRVNRCQLPLLPPPPVIRCCADSLLRRGLHDASPWRFSVNSALSRPSVLLDCLMSQQSLPHQPLLSPPHKVGALPLFL